jgi:hypothetical protein
VGMETEDIFIKDIQKTTKNRRATGPGHIKMEPIKYGEDRLIQFPKHIYNDIEKRSNIPEEWDMSYISLICKRKE